MKILDFSIERQYEIKCRLFTPDDGKVTRIILGVHGFAGDKDSSMLNKLALAGTERGAALICFDFPAHGASPVNEDCLTVENCKDDLQTVAAYISAQYPDAEKSIFATSFGGYITLLSAGHLADFSLVLRAPAVTMPKILLENVLKISAEDFRTAGVVTCGFERPIRLPYAFYEELLAQKIPDISRPMLIIHGDRDEIVPLEDVEAFVAAQNCAALHIIPGADHRFKHKGELDAVVAITNAFLNL